ncbi:uncharacterized protein PHACADRAFT_207441 [Phanerochaete carnosa HHB-10118-sp]|uniref:F-box domain-containing protein n=1 Tax=Phanerochaete carnosa (strain HHB-10118-sp) TaxID=650164 RepID=K5WHN2_PHACS|nr:uncharacterized protein PHACADRAFT_207441 [Phanerochaete carnosa HHB-10118-sp]EKM58634.1 hypothetical protein PHACADRAFT_207441 [Phanerochaete carnosa HHB-10118-sp]
MDPVPSKAGIKTIVDRHVSLINDILPLEVFDLVFDTLRGADNKKESLFSASLVCRLWREYTLRHRFYSISLDMSANQELKPLRRTSAYYLTQDFTKSKIFPLVQSFVQVLALSWGSEGVSLDFTRIIRLFPAVRTMKLEGALWPKQCLREKFAQPLFIDRLTILGTLPPYRRHLKLPHEVHALCTVLSQFSFIRHLFLVDIYNMRSDEELIWSNYALPPISSLTLMQTPGEGPISEVIKRLAKPGLLKHLDLTTFSGDELDEALLMAKGLSTPIEEIGLSVTCWGAGDGDGADARPNLFGLRSLKQLTIAIELEIASVGEYALDDRKQWLNSVSWTRATKALRSLDPSCCLEHIDLWLASSELEVAEVFLPRMQVALGHRCGSRVDFETAMLELVEQGRLRTVRMSLHCTPPTDDGLVPEFYVPSGDYLRDVFAHLDMTGALLV